MPAVGCLVPFLLLLVGGAIGGALGETTKDAIWGGGAGFVIGLVAAVLALRLYERMREGGLKE
jgi:hypothetical protein